jgi:hypothetical protein
MAKLTLSDLTNITGNETSAINTLNSNWDDIITALDNTLSRDGTTPNTMEADLDLNGNDLLNVGAITFGSSGVDIQEVMITTPDTTTDNAIVRWDGTDGTAIQDSGWILSDADGMTAGGHLGMGGSNISSVLNLTLTGGGTLDAGGGTVDLDGASLTGNSTYNGSQLDMSDNLILSAEIRDTSETAYNAGNMTGNVSLDYSDGHYQYGVLTGNATVTGVTNWPASGKSGSFVLEVAQSSGGSNTITFTGVEWNGGTAPTLTATADAIDVFTLVSRDGGTTVRGFVNGQDMS